MSKIHIVCVWVIVLLLCVAVSRVQAQDSKPFVQDRLAIGFWWPPRTTENLDQHYRDIAEANFTVVIGTYGMTAAEQLKLCEKYGLKALVHADGPADKLPDGPACWGYMLADEPSAAAFPALAARAQEIRTHRPGRFGYVNLYPNYAPAWALGTATYDEHVAKFVQVVKPEVLSMDHYPLMRPEGDTRDAYLANLRTMREQSLAAGIPFWNYFYAMPFNDRLDPTEAQIRWQIYASLAHGAKGVLYFCYWTPGKGNKGKGEFPKGGAIITAEGLKTRHYDQARRINAQLKKLGPTLMQLTSTAVVKLSTADSPPNLEGTHIRGIQRVAGDPHGEFIIGGFTHADGRRAVMIVNHSYMYTAWPTVEFAAAPGSGSASVMEVDRDSGEIVAAVDASPELPGLQISLDAGDGRLFILPAQGADAPAKQ